MCIRDRLGCAGPGLEQLHERRVRQEVGRGVEELLHLGCEGVIEAARWCLQQLCGCGLWLGIANVDQAQQVERPRLVDIGESQMHLASDLKHQIADQRDYAELVFVRGGVLVPRGTQRSCGRRLHEHRCKLALARLEGVAAIVDHLEQEVLALIE
eukprot:5464802-Alexandrium_andersonii.AAC.1